MEDTTPHEKVYTDAAAHLCHERDGMLDPRCSECRKEIRPTDLGGDHG